MTTISFLVNGTATGQTKSTAWVTIKEMEGDSLFFKVKQIGGTMGNLYGLYFDVTDESILNTFTLRINAVSNDIHSGGDSISCLRKMALT